MNEVTKLYKNANIEQDRMCEWTCRGSEFCSTNCEHYESTQLYYPPFTAEKQLNIIKWLLESYDIGFSQLGQRIDTSLDGANCISGLGSGDTFEESLSQAINDLWQDLTEEERKQIRNILESEVRE